MGKKRRIEEDYSQQYEEDRAPVEYNQHKQHAGGSRVEAETVSYLQEVSQHFSTLTDDDEKELLLANVLEEIQGKELRIASDAVASRLLEQLLVGAPASQLMQFLQAFTNEDLMFSLAGSAFGSHVAEKVLAGLHNQADQLDQQQADQLQELLAGMVGAIGSNLFDYIMDKHATHVARALLVVIAGRDVLSPVAKKKQQQQQQQQIEAEGSEHQLAAAAAAAGNTPAFKSKRSSLQEKLSGRCSVDVAPGRYPSLLRRYAKMLPCYDASNMSMLGKNSYSSPFIQAVLRAAAGDEELLLLLLPAILGVDSSKAAAAEPGQTLSSLTDSHMGRLLRDDCYSHLLEVVMTVMPKVLCDEFYTRFLKGRLLPLTNHHSANFVIQAWLAALKDAAMVQSAVDELAPHFADLLKRRRSGVIAAVVAAAGRAGAAAQQAAAAALAHALSQLPQWQGREGTDHLAPALLTLDTFATMGSTQQQQRHGSSSEGVRLSTPGAAILATILTSYSRKAAKPFVQSVVGLSPGDAVRAARDPAGSRALQALIEGAAAGSDSKSQLLSKLSGSWGDIALQAAGSFFLEVCYCWSDLTHKEVIVGDVAGRQAALLSGCYWGHKLMSRLGVEAYLRSPDEWRKRAASTAAAARAFEQMLEADQPTATEAGQSKKRKRQQHVGVQQQQQQSGSVTPDAAAAAAGQPGGSSSTSGKKVKKKARVVEEGVAAEGEAATAAAAADDASEEKQKKSKKRKHSDSTAAVGDTEQPAADGMKEKKRKKKSAAEVATPEHGGDDDNMAAVAAVAREKDKKEKNKRKRTSSPGQQTAAAAAGVNGDGSRSTDDILSLLTFGGNAAAGNSGKGQCKRHKTR